MHLGHLTHLGHLMRRLGAGTFSARGKPRQAPSPLHRVNLELANR